MHMHWVKVQNFKNPKLLKIQIFEHTACLQDINDFQFKWSIVFKYTDNKSENIL